MKKITRKWLKQRDACSLKAFDHAFPRGVMTLSKKALLSYKNSISVTGDDFDDCEYRFRRRLADLVGVVVGNENDFINCRYPEETKLKKQLMNYLGVKTWDLGDFLLELPEDRLIKCVIQVAERSRHI